MNHDFTYSQEISGVTVFKTVTLTPSYFVSINSSGDLRAQSAADFASAVGMVTTSTMNAALTPKAATTYVDAQLALKAATTTLTAHTSSTSNPHSVTKAQVGLSNVDNTSDANKPISIATLAALNNKIATSHVFTISEISSLQDTLDDKASLIHTHPISGITGLQAELDAKQGADALADHVTNVSNPHVVTKAQVGLSNVNNTSDANKPISTATQTALDLKASISSVSAWLADKVDSATFTAHTSNVSNPHSVTKAQVGLGSVDNTSDLDKPISNATRAALNSISTYGLFVDTTITTTGTTGDQTINKPSGRVNFEAAATSLVVTNDNVTTESIVMISKATDDATALLGAVVVDEGFFTIYMDTAPSVECAVNFLVLN